jgi:hypothetical protein
MKLLTKALIEKLIANGRESRERDVDHAPPVKLFTPDANATWLLTEVDPQNPDQAFGLCDLGLGTPELGYVSLQEISTLRGPLGLPVERDLYFRPAKGLREYATDARASGRVRA